MPAVEAVHESILEDLVGPAEIVGKRTRIGADGSKLLKVYLGPRLSWLLVDPKATAPIFCNQAQDMCNSADLKFINLILIVIFDRLVDFLGRFSLPGPA